jgi:hypothetical protein
MFRFTIRDVLWLTALVALAVAWWIDRSQVAAVNRELRGSLKGVETAMEAHGFLMQLDPRTGKAAWSFGDFDVDDP